MSRQDACCKEMQKCGVLGPDMSSDRLASFRSL